MNIHQLSVHHDERQDRLLLRFNTQDQQEFRFWLTRRMTLRLLPAIEQSALRLEAAQPGVAVADTPSQHLLTELKRDAFLKKADFTTPFESQPAQLPLGEVPMLITDAHLNLKPNGTLDISLEDKSDAARIQTCQLHLQVSLVHGMMHLIQQATEKAQWAPSLTPLRSPDASQPLAQEPPRYTH